MAAAMKIKNCNQLLGEVKQERANSPRTLSYFDLPASIVNHPNNQPHITQSQGSRVAKSGTATNRRRNSDKRMQAHAKGKGN